MTFRAIPPPTARQPLDAGVIRIGVLAMLALIVGSMLTYELVRSISPSTPLPRPAGERQRRGSGSRSQSSWTPALQLRAGATQDPRVAGPPMRRL
jgi:hypothetical protein